MTNFKSMYCITLLQGAVQSLFSADEGFASGGKDGCVKLWDTDFKLISTFDLKKAQEGYQGKIGHGLVFLVYMMVFGIYTV